MLESLGLGEKKQTINFTAERRTETKVAIARSQVTNPKFYAFDERTAALDSAYL